MSVVSILALATAVTAQSGASNAEMARISDDVVEYALQADPFLTHLTGVPADTANRLSDISPRAVADNALRVDALLKRIARVDYAKLTHASARRDYAIAREMLEAERGARICRQELWSVNHMSGWPAGMPDILQIQPVETSKQRADALRRWRSFPAFVAADLANLRHGLAAGYSSPRSVVERVIPQLDGMLNEKVEDSPFYSPAARSKDQVFRTQFQTLITEQINPALRMYRTYLRDTYLPKARTGISIVEIPNGRACYNARLRLETTLARTGEYTSALGQWAVDRNASEVRAVGRQLYGLADFAQIIAKLRQDETNRFKSIDELVSFAREKVTRGAEATAAVVPTMPAQSLEVRPMSPEMRASGRSSYYMPNGDLAKPAVFSLQIGKLEEQTRSDMAITAVHEGAPGHHLQFASSASLPTSRLSKIAFNGAYIEGWARYSEMLAEELGLFEDVPQAKIGRRSWPARGMVVDPGIHLFGWGRDKAITYIREAGRFSPTEAAAMVDRISVLPAQLTSYDTGGLEIRTLREEAKAALGAKFDLKAFHEVVLGEGVVPLWYLRRNVEAWVRQRKAR